MTPCYRCQAAPATPIKPGRVAAAFAAWLDYRLAQAATLADALEAYRDAVIAEGLALQAPVMPARRRR